MSSIRISENRDCNLQKKKDIFKERFFFYSADILNSFDVYKKDNLWNQTNIRTLEESKEHPSKKKKE